MRLELAPSGRIVFESDAELAAFHAMVLFVNDPSRRDEFGRFLRRHESVDLYAASVMFDTLGDQLGILP